MTGASDSGTFRSVSGLAALQMVADWRRVGVGIKPCFTTFRNFSELRNTDPPHPESDSAPLRCIEWVGVVFENKQ